MKNRNVLRHLFALAGVMFLITLFVSCSEEQKQFSEKDLTDFIVAHEAKMKPLVKEIAKVEFAAAVSGKDEDYKKAAELNIKLTAIYANKEEYDKLVAINKSDVIKDDLLKRQLDVLLNEYRFHQYDKQKMADMINAWRKLEQRFAVFRATIDSTEYSSNELNAIMSTSTDSEELKKAWEASKMVGEEVVVDFIKLVKMRNDAAKSVGFKNYFEMRLILSGQDPAELKTLYEEFDVLTRGPYSGLKKEIDQFLSERYDVAADKLMPWHYQDLFFQNAPEIYKVNYDIYYEGKDLVGLAKKYFKGIGLEIDDVIANSDLFDKKGKSPAGFSADIDREGDVRILLNVKEIESSMTSMLYESGFAVYLKNISRDLPFFLRTPAHFCTNDAVATMFSRLSTDPKWLNEYLEIPEEEIEKIVEDASKQLRLQKFVFAQWAQVMYNFERDLYENPNQDLNVLWWKYVRDYQLMNEPVGRNEKPDWATKIHFITDPCTYHNYIIGELYASQIQYYLTQNVSKGNENTSCMNSPDVGKFLIEKIFAPGAKMNWKDLIKYSTGESLNPDYYKMQYISVENKGVAN